MDNVLNLIIPFAGNLVSCLVLVLGIYHVISKRRDYVFSFILVSSAVYLLCNLLMAVEIDLAFALGLFAIFGIIRYRTDAIPIREMTYLFIVIALSVLNALAPAATGWIAVGAANVAVWIITFILDRLWAIRHLATKVVIYDRVDLLAEGRREELIRDLEQRTGVNIIRIEIGKVDLLRDTAVIKVHFDGDAQPGHFESQGGR
ncbi:MAG: DUF4956 domain-containing protein [Flavobacteriales bacterium]